MKDLSMVCLLTAILQTTHSTGAEGGPVCKICPLILTLDPYWGPQGGLK